jgi:hypothetical protein
MLFDQVLDLFFDFFNLGINGGGFVDDLFPFGHFFVELFFLHLQFFCLFMLVRNFLQLATI